MASSALEPRSSHVSDTAVQPFLQPDFNPAEYLNTALPALSVSSTPARGRGVPLSDLSAQLQTRLSQLNAQTVRLSNALTQLTDEIIRSGSRLAYEVEVLRGETRGLTDTFENDLKKDIELFTSAPAAGNHLAARENDGEAVDGQDASLKSEASEPEFLERLRTLILVRERLDSVIKTFGSAMQWSLAPSELSVASSFISVSAPENDTDNRSREEKGKEYAENLRHQVNDLLASGADGIEAATMRVDEMRSLAEVWKGTAEEKARFRLVESLQKLVEDKQKALSKASSESSKKPGNPVGRGHDYRYGNTDTSKALGESGTGYGFLQNLRNLKNEMYLD